MVGKRIIHTDREKVATKAHTVYTYIDTYSTSTYIQLHSSTYLEQEGSQGPPVNCLAMSLIVQNLRGQVLGGAAEGLGAALRVVAGDARLRQTEVRDANVTSGIQSGRMYVCYVCHVCTVLR